MSVYKKPVEGGLGSVRSGSVLFGVVAQALQLGSGLLLLPIVVRTLPPSEVGLWYVFVSIQSLVGLLDFGFTQTFSHNFSYVLAGAQGLKKEGVVLGAGATDYRLLGSLSRASRWGYFLIAVGCASMLAIGGSTYLDYLGMRNEMPGNLWSAWAVFVVGVTVNVFYQWQAAMLTGGGHVKENYKIAITSRVAQIGISITGLMLHPSIMSLVLAYTLSVFVTRSYGHFSIRRLIPQLSESKGDDTEARRLLSVIWHTAHKLGWVMVGTFLINRFNLFAIAYFLGLSASAQYAISYQAYLAILGVAQVVFSIYMPTISASRIAGDKELLRSLFARSTLYSWVVYAVGAATLIVAGPLLLHLINSNTSLPPTPVLILMAIVYFLEANHSACSGVIVSANQVPFVKAAVLSGMAIGVGTLIVGTLGGGLLAFVAVQGAVQLAYNNWKWPTYVYRELNLRVSMLPFYATRRVPS